MVRQSDNQRVRVLSSPGEWQQGDNPFLQMLFESYGDGVELIHFTWWRAFKGSYDVLHLHWPEFLMRGSGRIKNTVKQLLFVLLILKTQVFNIPTIWTVHNDEPHEAGGRLGSALFERWGKTVTQKVHLSDWAANHDTFPSDRCTVIRHGHYLPILNQEHSIRIGPHPLGPRLLFFGFLRPYKGIENLIDAFGSIRSERPGSGANPSLRIVGKAISVEYGLELSRRATSCSTIELTDTFLNHAELEKEIAETDLVILPYSKMYNSGAVLLSLSVKRPVLVPESPTMKELQAEVGSNWVRMYVPPLNSAHLNREIKWLSERGLVQDPVLSGRGWSEIGESYTALFLKLAREGRRR